MDNQHIKIIRLELGIMIRILQLFNKVLILRLIEAIDYLAHERTVAACKSINKGDLCLPLRACGRRAASCLCLRSSRRRAARTLRAAAATCRQ